MSILSVKYDELSSQQHITEQNQTERTKQAPHSIKKIRPLTNMLKPGADFFYHYNSMKYVQAQSEADDLKARQVITRG